MDFSGSLFRICGSRRRRYVLPGAGALRTFYLEPEPEPKCFAGAGAVKNCHGSASLVHTLFMIPPVNNLVLTAALSHSARVVLNVHWSIDS